jgi:hypothetical protein
LAVIGAVLLLGSSAAWAQIIDPFSTGTGGNIVVPPLTAPAAIPPTEISGLVGVEGGVRYMELFHSSGTGGISLVVNTTSDLLEYSSGTSTAGRGLVVWDGTDDDSITSPGGLSFDVSPYLLGGSILLRAFSDIGATLWVTLCTSGGCSAPEDIAVPVSATLVDLLIPLSSFADIGSFDLDADSILTRIELAIAGAGGPTTNAPTATDVSVDLVGFVSPIPEPATISLFGLGLATLAGLARRRRARNLIDSGLN